MIDLSIIIPQLQTIKRSSIRILQINRDFLPVISITVPYKVYASDVKGLGNPGASDKESMQLFTRDAFIDLSTTPPRLKHMSYPDKTIHFGVSVAAAAWIRLVHGYCEP